MEQASKIVKRCKIHGELTENECFRVKTKYFLCKTCYRKTKREYYHNNYERIAEKQKILKEKYSDRYKKYSKEYYFKNSEARRKYAASYRKKNKAILNQKAREYSKKNYLKECKNLSDNYIKHLIDRKKSSQAPVELIPAYREFIKLKRMLRELKKNGQYY